MSFFFLLFKFAFELCNCVSTAGFAAVNWFRRCRCRWQMKAMPEQRSGQNRSALQADKRFWVPQVEVSQVRVFQQFTICFIEYF